ncbi:hypothetical protein ABZ619_38920 [Streptomyces sp. NPDC007851]|uniref:hypothetical protein n=1 Tax=Streptomyces sp. NPDC007851 TaxID=3155008 RepID=UPI0033C2CBC8
MTYFNLRKRDPDPEPETPEEDVEPEENTEGDEAQEQESEARVVLGLLPAYVQGARNWCAWCSAKIGAGWAYTGHVVAVWAVFHYDNAMVTFGVLGGLGLAFGLFAPREAFDRAVERMAARDLAKFKAQGEAAQAPTAEAVEEAPVEAPADPLVALMWRLISDAPGVHRKTLTEVLAEAAVKAGNRPPSEADVEASLEEREIPLRPSVRDTRGKVNRGVHRDDLKAWEEARSPTVSEAVSPAP